MRLQIVTLQMRQIINLVVYIYKKNRVCWIKSAFNKQLLNKLITLVAIHKTAVYQISPVI